MSSIRADMDGQGEVGGEITVEALVTGTVRLVSLPEVYLRINEILDAPLASAADIGEVIAQDASLTARLLRIVNSAFYGYPSRIQTVTRAITIIGARELRGLVLAASALESLARIAPDLLAVGAFWRHSVYCGVVAQCLADRLDVLHSERLFVAGLLHDIGKLVIYQRIPEQARIIRQQAAESERPEFEHERERLGFDHAEVGRALLTEWQMPEPLREAVGAHHAPTQAVSNPMDAALVHLANALSAQAEAGLEGSGPVQPVEEAVWSLTGLDENDCEAVLREAGPRFAQALGLIMPRGRPG